MLASLALLLLAAQPEAAGPTRVLYEPDTALISPDPGNRLIEALAAKREALDACAEGLAALIEQGASPSIAFKFKENGKLDALTGLDQPDEPKGIQARLTCFKKVLGSLKVESSRFPRSGTLYFKPDKPFVAKEDPTAASARLEKSERGITLTLTGKRQQAGTEPRFGLSYQATVTNTGKTPRGVRQRFLYANAEHNTDGGSVVSRAAMLSTDTQAPVTCLKPGESLTAELGGSDKDGIKPGGSLSASPFVVVGDCVNPAERVWVGGLRLDWTDKTKAEPRLIAMPYWVHQVVPLTPRETWR
ncbi:hypothetical protein MYSTI_02184 [Myxococcus stipitatus DSM 14675]|uniref:Lipoprotein n=1 Tax=Myxococcus stipitatus (strain DSM 14675 / JCM 12634 / Mx s8) TaxID=1278073 RepID=L7U419_MYXSD|nr:hypothetical protein [Myxococcus stipitatus]AGC43511.1 hypothetical protein MYSTI_02184 [Myxococcus stipitatus DSM 14675]